MGMSSSLSYWHYGQGWPCNWIWACSYSLISIHYLHRSLRSFPMHCRGAYGSDFALRKVWRDHRSHDRWRFLRFNNENLCTSFSQLLAPLYSRFCRTCRLLDRKTENSLSVGMAERSRGPEPLRRTHSAFGLHMKNINSASHPFHIRTHLSSRKSLDHPYVLHIRHIWLRTIETLQNVFTTTTGWNG
jgi:hypothetical protein